MLFSSAIFLVYFLPVFLLVYYLLGKRLKNFWILSASAVFYAWGGPLFIFVILSTTLIDFFLVRWMASVEAPRRKKRVLVFSIFMNIGMLLVFKYGNFTVDNLNWIRSWFGGEPWLIMQLIPPLAISFFTFESLTYVIDVYRGVHPPLKNFVDYQMYILMFPKLLAGPIVRYHDIAEQVRGRFAGLDADMILTGFYRFATGLAKKVLIADVLGHYVKQVFDAPAESLAAGTAWLGLIGFLFQLYFDFSGYSDMALGLCRMMGFSLPENFNNPLTSRSVTEYWQRWHISLGAWMRNYLYIPLGGNRNSSRSRLYLNLGIIFLISGVWHGTGWHFVFFGLWHGGFMILERAFLMKWLGTIPGIIRIFYTILVFISGTILFTAESAQDAFRYAASLGGSEGTFSVSPGMEFWLTFSLAILLSWWILLPGGQKTQNIWFGYSFSFRGHAAMTLITLMLFFLSLAYVVWSPLNPFIYFRF